MKIYQNYKNSFKLTWITIFTGLITIGCTPEQPPNIQTLTPQPTPTATSVQTPAPIPVASPISPTTTPKTTPKTTPTTPARQETKSVPLNTTKPKDCKITNAKVNDPNPPANVRSSPEVKADNIVGKLDNGRVVFVEAETEGWLQITEPKGWISKKIVETECSQINQTVNLDNNNQTIIKGRFIGTGSHTYLLQAKEGQTLSITAEKGPIPFVVSPTEKELTGGGDYTGKKSWSGKLPTTGDYLLKFDSNFKGYDYQLLVELK